MPSLDPGIIEKFAPCPFCDEPLDIELMTTTTDEDGKPDDIYTSLSCGNCDIEFHCNRTPKEDETMEYSEHFNPELLLEWWNGISPQKLCWRCQNWHEEKYDDEKICFCAIEEYDTVAWDYGKHNSCKDFEKKIP